VFVFHDDQTRYQQVFLSLDRTWALQVRECWRSMFDCQERQYHKKSEHPASANNFLQPNLLIIRVKKEKRKEKKK
jgi:hypothetical protein